MKDNNESYSTLGMEEHTFMNPAEQQIKSLAQQGDFMALRACIDLAAENPQGMIAEELEVVGLRVLAYDLFTNTKSTISLLHESRPKLVDALTAANQLEAYEKQIAKYLSEHTTAWNEIVAPPQGDPLQVRTAILTKLIDTIVQKEPAEQGIVKKAFVQMGDIQVNIAGLRTGIAAAASDVTENIWNVVQQGRDSQVDLMEGKDITDIASGYHQATDQQFTAASDVATMVIQRMSVFGIEDQPPTS